MRDRECVAEERDYVPPPGTLRDVLDSAKA